MPARWPAVLHSTRMDASSRGKSCRCFDGNSQSVGRRQRKQTRRRSRRMGDNGISLGTPPWPSSQRTCIRSQRQLLRAEALRSRRNACDAPRNRSVLASMGRSTFNLRPSGHQGSPPHCLFGLVLTGYPVKALWRHVRQSSEPV